MAKPAVLTEYTVISPKLSGSLRIALVSDLHERRADDILELLKESKPDLIAVPGDMLERYAESGSTTYRTLRYNAFQRFLVNMIYHINRISRAVFCRNNLHDPEFTYEFLSVAAGLAPVFMSPGNHEECFPEEDLRRLTELGIRVLDNEDVSVEIKGQRLRIGGLSSVFDSEWLDGFQKKDGVKLLLCHHPEYYDSLIADKNIDLVLSGHNHGGQIKLFGRAIFSPGGGFLPKYEGGVYHDRMVVSRGCSNTAAIPRINNPRELVLIHFKNS